MEKLFFLKLLTSALYILILFASAFIVIGLIIEFRRSCSACSSYNITYFYKNPSDFLPDKSYLPLLFSLIPALFSIPLFFSVLTYNILFSFLLGSIVFSLIKILQPFFIDTFCFIDGVFWFYFFISAVFLILSYGVFKRKKYIA